MITQDESCVFTPEESSLLATESEDKNGAFLDASEKKSRLRLKTSLDSKVYACPKKGCPRHAESLRKQFFPDFYQLKMHYQTVHGEKKFKCEKCLKAFGNHKVFRHHLTNCTTGKLYSCECGATYKSRNALLTHARRKQHIIEEKKDNSETRINSTNPHETTTTVISLSSQNFVTSHDIGKKNVQLPRLLRVLPAKPSKDDVKKTPLPSTLSTKSDQNDFGLNTPSKSFVRISNNRDEIDISTKNIVDTFTQTPLNIMPLTSPLKKTNILTQTVNYQDNTRKNTIDTQTHVDISYLGNQPFKITLDAPDSYFPETVNMDTQTNVDLDQFDEKILTTTSDTQTEKDYFIDNPFIPQKSFIDTQTQVTLFHIDGMKTNMNTQTDSETSTQTYMSSMNTQTQINSCNFNEIIKKFTMDTQTDSLFCQKQTVEAETQMNYINETTEVLETSDASVQCYDQYFYQDNIHNDSLVSDNETQTDPMSNWLKSLNQEFTHMETQTNFNYPIPVQRTFDVEPMLLDKSVQLEDMIGLGDTYNMNPVAESSNISTQTVNFENDPWLVDNLVFESSSTQTDFFDDFDLTGIDFTVNKETPEGSQSNKYSGDELISGNTSNEGLRQDKNNIETQTTISLYDLLDSSLISNYFNMDKCMSHIETQTAEEYSEIFVPHRSNIETQTDYF